MIIKAECLMHLSLVGAMALRKSDEDAHMGVGGEYVCDDSITCEECGLESKLKIFETASLVMAPGRLGAIDEIQSGGDKIIELRAAMTVPRSLTERCRRHLENGGRL